MARIIMHPKAHMEAVHAVKHCKTEVSWLGRVLVQSDGGLYVPQIYFLEQECDSGSTVLKAEAIAKLMYETRDEEGELAFWGHSHVNMGVFWSGVDMAMFNDWTGVDGSFLCGTVYNKKGDMRSALMANHQTLGRMFVDDIDYDVDVVGEVREEIEKATEAVLDKVVTRKVAAYTRGYGGYTTKGVNSYASEVRYYTNPDTGIRVKWENNERFEWEDGKWVKREFDLERLKEQKARAEAKAEGARAASLADDVDPDSWDTGGWNDSWDTGGWNGWGSEGDDEEDEPNPFPVLAAALAHAAAEVEAEETQEQGELMLGGSSELNERDMTHLDWQDRMMASASLEEWLDTLKKAIDEGEPVPQEYVTWYYEARPEEIQVAVGEE